MDKSAKMPGAHNPSIKMTERASVALLMHWIRNLIKEKNLGLGCANVETISDDRKMPDLVITESKLSQDALCVIEAKRPQFDIYNEEDLKEPARKKANFRKAKYFAVTNFQDLILFNTEKVNANRDLSEQIIDEFALSKILNLDHIENPRYKNPIHNGLSNFLTKLYNIHTSKEALPLHPIDQHWIYWLHRKVERLSHYYSTIIENNAHKDKNFKLRLRRWINDQGWSFTGSESDFIKAAHQTAYLLVNKILFYMMLQAKRSDFDPLEIPESMTKGSLLQNQLQGYFNDVLKVDYLSIYTTDFIDTIAFPEEKEVVEEIKEFVRILNRYDFGRIPYDIIGRIFEKLIPEKERHNLGQYFTNSDVVDIILRFSLKHEDESVLDPSCGAGTFLVRAYHHKKFMNYNKKHEDILNTLWGNDIAKFPTHLATINLAIRNLEVDENYPNIIRKDFFELKAGKEGIDPESFIGEKESLNKTKKELKFPRFFDVIVGNPPYTRQEEIRHISTQYDKKKKYLITSSLLDDNGRRIADLSKRAGIHAYFFVHGWKFLKEGGRFGFVVSNSWMDVEYGRILQEFFLKHYKIICIIESKVERWFADADVNTCIIILEKCSDEKVRNENHCRFVYLKKPLDALISPPNESWEKQRIRFNEIDALIKTILAHNEFYENDDLRIYPVQQVDLWNEGFDKIEKKYTGAKWGKYIRAPEIYFKILENGKDKLIKLKEITTVRRGFTTGSNEFFYMTQNEARRKKIASKYIQPIVFSLKEIKTYRVNKKELNKRALICWQDRRKLYGTKTFDYIQLGEKKKYNQRPTCASRNPWYALGKNWPYAPLIFPAKVGERMPVALNDDVYEDKKLYGIIPNESGDTILLAALLNSTLTRFFIEFTCRQLTGAQAIADIDVVVVENLPVLSFRFMDSKIKRELVSAFNDLSVTPAESIFKEIGSSPENVALDKIKKERRELDRIILGDILGLTEDQQLEVYRAVVDLVRSRLDKANSVKGNNEKEKEELSITSDSVVETIKVISKKD